MIKSLGELFRVRPDAWAARGDPYLWQEMERIFASVPMPNRWSEIQEKIDSAFFTLTGQRVSYHTWFYVEKYAHGGMSSGYVEPTFWTEGGIGSNFLRAKFETL